jgi:hypothetical protein
MVTASLAQAELYEAESPSPWIVRDVTTSDTLTCFDVTLDGLLVGLDGLSINLYDTDGAFMRTLGRVPDYNSGDEYAAFCRISPHHDEVWVGYTVLGNTDDRVYSVSMSAQNATATHRATMPGIYDLEFAYIDDQLTAFAGGTNDTTFGSPHKVWVLDLSGDDNHVLIADIGGYGAGIALDAYGRLYATSTQGTLYRFDMMDVYDALMGGAALSTDNADMACDIGFGGSDVTIDVWGNVFYNGNATDYSGASLIGVLDPTTGTWDNIATGSGSAGNWSTFLATSGYDVLSGDGTLYVGDFYAFQTLTQISIPEPATLGLLLLGSLGLLARRR